MEGHLKQQEKGSNGPWLVGGKFSYVDLAWLPWYNTVATMLSEDVDISEYKTVLEWIERVKKQPGVAKCLADS